MCIFTTKLPFLHATVGGWEAAAFHSLIPYLQVEVEVPLCPIRVGRAGATQGDLNAAQGQDGCKSQAEKFRNDCRLHVCLVKKK